VRAAKSAGLPVTCDVTPHHLALTDGWLAGWRRFAWDEPWRPGATCEASPYETSVRVNPPLRSVADAAACRAAVEDGTADAIATDHAPHTSVAKDVEFGLASTGISGIETALGLLLAAVDVGELSLGHALAALTVGPSRVLGFRPPRVPRGLVEGVPADLVVFDRSEGWTVTAESLASKGKNSPLLGRSLPGRVLLTVAGGRLAYSAG
jgi:dihydroorotase